MAYNDAKQTVAFSPVDKAPFFPDDKIVSVSMGALPTSNQSIPRSTTMATKVVTIASPPEYIEAQLPPRSPKPFWKRRRAVWVLLGVVLVIIFIGAVAGIVANKHSKTRSETKTSPQQQNSTMASVASSGLFLKDRTTWNMQTYTQNATGDLQYRLSTDGQTFQDWQNISLSIAARAGSPLSATAATDDTTGVVYLSLFYLAAASNIAVCQLACAAGSSICSVSSNSLIVTKTPPNPYTGLAAINVNDAQDWRVYYLDNTGLLSEIGGNLSGFNTGGPIGGLGLNSSSIAAVNVNSTTNNINVFYVDQLTQALYTLQFTNAWSIPAIVSTARVTFWNPLSGLGAAYSVGQDQLHVYYTGLDTGIYEFLGNKASTTKTVWGALPGRNHIWAQADIVGADITAVGWKDQVRFFQMSGERLVEGSLSNLTWTESFV